MLRFIAIIIIIMGLIEISNKLTIIIDLLSKLIK